MRSNSWTRAALAFLAMMASMGVLAEDPIRIGLVLPLSGPFANYGAQIGNGARLFLNQTGGSLNGHPVELLVRDDTGTAPELTKRIAQELVTRDKVDVLAGFALTPGAAAAASVAQKARVPMVIMNAASSMLTTKSDYIVRVSHTLPQLAAPIASWAAAHDISQVYSIVADYAPGIDAQQAFKKAFVAAGKEIIGEVQVPLSNTDFNSYLRRIRDARPQAVFVFLPPGDGTIGFLKAWNELGLDKAGIKLIGTVDLIDDDLLENIGALALGTVTSGHYSAAHDSSLNKRYVDQYMKAYGMRPNYMSVAGYDGMKLIESVFSRIGTGRDAEKFIETAKTMSWESPRGQVHIDPVTRDIVQTVYIRRTELIDGKPYAIEFDRFADVKDPGK